MLLLLQVKQPGFAFDVQEELFHVEQTRPVGYRWYSVHVPRETTETGWLSMFKMSCSM